MNDWVRLLTLQDANTRIPMLGTALLGLACGLVGTFAVLRKRALVGDAVAHAALPGVAVAYLILGGRNFPLLLLGAGLAGLLAAVMITFVRANTKIKDDAITAIVIGGFFGVGTVLSRVAQDQGAGNVSGLDAFIFGKAATMVRGDVLTIGIATIGVGAVIGLLFKEFKLLCFDRDFAGAQGWPTRRLDLLLMGLICLATVVALPAVGVVLAVALLVIPPAAARFWSDRLSIVLILAAVFGAFSGILGTAFSAVVPAPSWANIKGWPTGPIITLAATMMFVISMLLAPKRGILPAFARKLAFQRRIGVENLLRAAYEVGEARGDLTAPLSREALLAARSWTASALDVSIVRARSRGYIERESLRMTPIGLERARDTVRRHRLWELFLVENAGIAADHVDRDADLVEHLLPPELLARLDARLRPVQLATMEPPASPHPIAPEPPPPARTMP